MTGLLKAEWVSWLATIGLIAMLLFLVYAAWWALFADRPRGRRRCPRCWHDLSFTPGLRCSECGNVARDERALGRTRRRMPIAVLAIFGCVAINLFVVDRATTRGWLSWAPNRALLWALPVADDPTGMVRRELDLRMRSDTLTDDQWIALAERCAAGDGEARPPGDAWIGKYEPLVGVVRQRTRTVGDGPWTSAIRDLLLTIPPRIEFDTRATWPADVAVTLDAIARDWWPDGVEARITATPRVPGAEPTVSVRRDDPIQRVSFAVGLPPLSEGRHEVPIDVAVEFRGADTGAWSTAATTTVTVPIVVAGTLDERLEAVSGTEHDDRMRRVFARGLAKWATGSLPVRVRIDPRPTLDPIFDGAAIGVRIDVLRDGKLARRLDSWWRAGSDSANARTSWEVPYWDDELLGIPSRPEDVWSVHVTSRPELALRVPGATRYWSGEITTKVPVVQMRGSAPARGWILETSKQDGPAPGSAGESR